ncbi:arsenical-resistance protein [Paraburkholderia sp. GAS41]
MGGILVGQLLPQLFQAIGRMEVAHVNLPVGVLIWVMIIPMLIKIDFGAMTQVRSQWRGIGVTLFVNWLVKPFSMAFLGLIFIRHVFASWLPADQLHSYIAGLILLAAAPCTAMVFVWSQLCKGDPYFTLSQVALNDSIMIVAFAPLVALLLGLSAITVPWDTLIISVGLYIVIPVILAQLLRRHLLARGEAHFRQAVAHLGPYSISALLATLVLLFAFQGQAIVKEPLVIAMLAVPILIQVFFNSGLAYLLNRRLGVAHCVAGPSSLTGASNFFELAVATAISLFGFYSGAALATVVGVLIKVPVMLFVVWIGLGVAMAATLYDPVFAVITRDFPGSFRTKITLITLVAGFASTVFIPLTQLLVDRLQWRGALLALAGFNLAICLPIHVFAIGRDAPREDNRDYKASLKAINAAATSRALRTPTFWALAVCFTAYYATFAALTFHLVPLMAERRVLPALILTTMAVIGPAQVLARVLWFTLGRNVRPSIVGVIVTAALPASVVVLMCAGTSSVLLIVFAIIYGGANGMMTILRGTIVQDVMWTEGYGAVSGLLSMPSNVAKGIAPVSAAAIWTAGGNYVPVEWTVLLVSLVSAVAFIFAIRVTLGKKFGEHQANFE